MVRAPDLFRNAKIPNAAVGAIIDVCGSAAYWLRNARWSRARIVEQRVRGKSLVCLDSGQSLTIRSYPNVIKVGHAVTQPSFGIRLLASLFTAHGLAIG